MRRRRPKKRYVLSSVSGYLINDVDISARGPGREGEVPVIWSVLDSAYCYRQMGEFRGKGGERRARELLERLNAEAAA